MNYKLLLVASSLCTAPALAQSSSALCGLDMYGVRIATDYGPGAMDSEGTTTASLLVNPGSSRVYLRLWDMSDSNDPQVDSTTQLNAGYYGNANTVSLSLSGSVVAVGTDYNDEVRLVDISDTLNPIVRSSIVADVDAVEVVGDRLYVLTPTLLSVYEISDLDAPALLGTVAGSFTKALDIVGNQMYVGNTSDQLQIFDVSNPASITPLGDFTTSVSPDAVDVDGELAAIGAENTLVMIDVSDPSSPVELGSAENPENLLNVIIHGDWVYSSSEDSASIFDISDPNSPMFQIKLTGPEVQSWPQVTVSNGLLWVQGAMDFFQVHADQSNQINPEIFAGLVPEALPTAKFEHVAVHQGYIYAIDKPNNRLVVIDDTQGPEPVIVSDVYMGSGLASDIAFDGNKAFLMRGSGTIRVFDITDPTSLSSLGSWSARPDKLDWSGGSAIEIEGSLLYACSTYGAFTIHDISDPLSPVLLSEYLLSEGDENTEFVVSNGFVAVYHFFTHNGENGTVKVIDCTDPSSPVLETVGFNTDILDLKLVGNQILAVNRYAYPGDPRVGSFESLSRSGQPWPTTQIRFTNPDDTFDGGILGPMVIKDNLAILPAYFGNYSVSSLAVIDIADPEVPSIVGSIAIPTSLNRSVSTATDGNRLYSVSGLDAKLRIYDISTCVPACPSDLTNDGLLNFLDISAFLTAFGNQDPAADFETDGNFNFLDVSAFLVAFGAGCP
jgi:hypothetical protein